MTKDKKKDKQKPRKPQVDLMVGRPRPRAISFQGPTQLLEAARNDPVLGCWIMQSWQERGITPIIVARKMNNDRVVYGVFLVDLYCLGVKNAYWKVDISLRQFERDLPRLCSNEPDVCEVSLAHEIIYGGIDYARKYGFEPHSDFAKASLLLDPPDAHARIHQVEFGHEGKPFFVAGPYDDAGPIVNKLRRTAGEGNFTYLVGFNGPEIE